MEMEMMSIASADKMIEDIRSVYPDEDMDIWFDKLVIKLDRFEAMVSKAKQCINPCERLELCAITIYGRPVVNEYRISDSSTIMLNSPNITIDLGNVVTRVR